MRAYVGIELKSKILRNQRSGRMFPKSLMLKEVSRSVSLSLAEGREQGK